MSLPLCLCACPSPAPFPARKWFHGAGGTLEACVVQVVLRLQVEAPSETALQRAEVLSWTKLIGSTFAEVWILIKHYDNRGTLTEGNHCFSTTEPLISHLMMRYGTNRSKQAQDNHWVRGHHRPQCIQRASVCGEEAFFCRCLLEYSKYFIFNKNKKLQGRQRNRKAAQALSLPNTDFKTLKGNHRPYLNKLKMSTKRQIIATRQRFRNWKGEMLIWYWLWIIHGVPIFRMKGEMSAYFQSSFFREMVWDRQGTPRRKIKRPLLCLARI